MIGDAEMKEAQKITGRGSFSNADDSVSNLEAAFAALDFYAKPRAEFSGLETQLKTARITAGP